VGLLLLGGYAINQPERNPYYPIENQPAEGDSLNGGKPGTKSKKALKTNF
jgi:hypothetical protein